MSKCIFFFNMKYLTANDALICMYATNLYVFLTCHNGIMYSNEPNLFLTTSDWLRIHLIIHYWPNSSCDMTNINIYILYCIKLIFLLFVQGVWVYGYHIIYIGILRINLRCVKKLICWDWKIASLSVGITSTSRSQPSIEHIHPFLQYPDHFVGLCLLLTPVNAYRRIWPLY